MCTDSVHLVSLFEPFFFPQPSALSQSSIELLPAMAPNRCGDGPGRWLARGVSCADLNSLVLTVVFFLVSVWFVGPGHVSI